MYSDTLDMDFSFDVPVRRPALLSRKIFDVPVRPMDAKGLIADLLWECVVHHNLFFFQFSSLLNQFYSPPSDGMRNLISVLFVFIRHK